MTATRFQPEATVDTPEGIYFEVAARFLEVQISTDDVLDNKAAGAFSVGSTILHITFGLLNLSGRAPSDGQGCVKVVDRRTSARADTSVRPYGRRVS